MVATPEASWILPKFFFLLCRTSSGDSLRLDWSPNNRSRTPSGQEVNVRDRLGDKVDGEEEEEEEGEVNPKHKRKSTDKLKLKKNEDLDLVGKLICFGDWL